MVSMSVFSLSTTTRSILFGPAAPIQSSRHART
jgi:hypothetical protein